MSRFAQLPVAAVGAAIAIACQAPEPPGSSLALTPPMGWNSWNRFACDVSESLIRETADAMVASGMRDVGYEYVVIDDCWQVDRTDDGTIVADPERFPSGIAALAEYVHSKGLKFGLYTDIGPKTCQGRPGSYGHFLQDAQTYAAWGVDYVKVDWCHADSLDAQSQYKAFREALDATGRPIVLSICEWGRNRPWEWARGIGQLWRVTGDIWDGWQSVVWIMNANAPHWEAAGPGHWNDADMLEVGNGGMTFDEYRAHFAMWAMMASPLMAGNDLRKMSEETRSILTNPAVIAVNQDSLGAQARVIMDRGYGGQVWVKPLADGSRAVAMLNLRPDSLELYVRWSDISIPAGPARVRDLWERRDLGVHVDPGEDFGTRFRARVPGHGVVLLRIWPGG
ncbi:MAG: glycoside hydrolase family 27 protein [Gemmatimonadales bacterium]